MTIKHRAYKGSNKLSNKLWNAHERLYGRNNLSTLTKSFGDDYVLCSPYDVYDFWISQDEQPIDEFGGLPDHFDVRKQGVNHTLQSDMFALSLYDGSDPVVRIDRLKMRRAGRFIEIAGRRVKRLDRLGHTATYHYYEKCEKEIRATKEKAVGKRKCVRLFAETILDIEADQKVLEAEIAGAVDDDHDEIWMSGDFCCECGQLVCDCDVDAHDLAQVDHDDWNYQDDINWGYQNDITCGDCGRSRCDCHILESERRREC